MDGRRPARAGAQNPAYRPARPPPEQGDTLLSHAAGWGLLSGRVAQGSARRQSIVADVPIGSCPSNKKPQVTDGGSVLGTHRHSTTLTTLVQRVTVSVLAGSVWRVDGA